MDIPTAVRSLSNPLAAQQSINTTTTTSSRRRRKTIRHAIRTTDREGTQSILTTTKSNDLSLSLVKHCNKIRMLEMQDYAQHLRDAFIQQMLATRLGAPCRVLINLPRAATQNADVKMHRFIRCMSNHAHYLNHSSPTDVN